MLSVGVFGVGLLGGMGASTAGKAAAAYQTSDKMDEKETSRAQALYIGYLTSTVVLLGSMVGFIVLLALSFYKKPSAV